MVCTSYGPMAILLEWDGFSALNTETRIWLIVLRKRCFFIYYHLLSCRGVKSLLVASGCDKSVIVYVHIIPICLQFSVLANSECVFFRQIVFFLIKDKDKKTLKVFFSPAMSFPTGSTTTAT